MTARPRRVPLIGELLGTLGAPRDELMLEAGAVGELLVARIRLVVAGLIFLLPLIAWLSGAPDIEVFNGALVATLAVVFALFLRREARRRGVSVPLRYLSTAFDITCVSLVLSMFLLQGFPHTAVNSRVVWELYLISIAATALRADPRVCVFGGALATVQYSAIIAGALSFGDLSDPRFEPFAYGFFSWGDQLSRLVILALATLLALAGVMQTCRLLSMSSRDRMTGLRNRAYLDTRLAREIRETALLGRPLSLAVVDADHFKAFNDRHGHLAGDAALRNIAEQLRRCVDEPGFAARYGGEEFVVVLPGTALPEAVALCERIRSSVDGQWIAAPSGERLPASSVSIGVAAMAPDMTADELVDAADRALIAAKRGGRGRVADAASARASPKAPLT